MKLILCAYCSDVVKGHFKPRECKCGMSGIQYLNQIDAVYWGEAIPLGFANSSLQAAALDQPESGMGEEFTAFVIPKVCPTFKKIDPPVNQVEYIQPGRTDRT